MAQDIVIVGPNLPGPLQRLGTFHVHAKGCADLKRGLLRRALQAEPPLCGRYKDKWDVVSMIYSDHMGDSGDTPETISYDDASPYIEDFHYAPCVDLEDGYPEDGEDGISAEDLTLAATLLENAYLKGEKIPHGKQLVNDITNLVSRLREAAGE